MFNICFSHVQMGGHGLLFSGNKCPLAEDVSGKWTLALGFGLVVNGTCRSFSRKRWAREVETTPVSSQLSSSYKVQVNKYSKGILFLTFECVAELFGLMKEMCPWKVAGKRNLKICFKSLLSQITLKWALNQERWACELISPVQEWGPHLLILGN